MDNKLIKNIVEEIRDKLSYMEESDKNVYEIICESCFQSERLEDLTVKELGEIVDRARLSIETETSILEPYLKRDGVTEIMINGAEDIFVEEKGKIYKIKDSFLDEKELEDIIRRIGSRINREINENNPILDARLKDGARVNAVYRNLTGKSSVLTIRRFDKKHIGLDELIECNTITREAVDFLKRLISAGYNIFISGGTSSGKTTLLNALTTLIDKKERVIVIEDSREIDIVGIDNLIQLECRQVSNGIGKSIGIDDLIKTSLRMRPDRIIVGEIRDGKAMINMLNGFNTGHSGICTGHANSSIGMIRRMESFYMQESNFPIESIDEQIAQAIDIIVQIGRLKDGSRKILEISEIVIDDDRRIALNKLFEYKDKRLQRTEKQLVKVERLELVEKI